MSTEAPLPRRFGTYLLTAFLGKDVLGRVFRAVRTSGERAFVRLRLFESSEISEDSVLDAIEENGEIHAFLKNPAIARGVQMDAVEGTPFLAWNEPNGRTLDAVIAKARDRGQGIPIEHALLIGEKIATALDHAYNTTIDGERTLHGLVSPAFVSVSDDGETRLTGFGLASGFFPSLGRPGFQQEVAPYLAPEERASRKVEKNSDVYSVGVILFELLFGRLPASMDPVGDIRNASLAGPAIPPEVADVLRMCLSPAESRYQSSGELRRELGKILFSGPYSPSTFNLAFFLSGLFGAEIEAENQARSREINLEARTSREIAAPRSAPAPSSTVRPVRPPPAPSGARRAPWAVGGALLVAAALAGTAFVVFRRPSGEARRTVAQARRWPTPLPTAEPTSPPTSVMTENQFKEEVARRVSTELKKLQDEMKRRGAPPIQAGRSPQPAPAQAAPEPSPRKAAAAEMAEPTAPPRAEPTPEPTAVPTPLLETRSIGSDAPPDEGQVPPKILRIVKPTYPPLALRARIKGIVLLRVLVSDTGVPEQIEVLRGVVGGLTEAATAAVRKWTFEPARRNGQPVKAWTTIPIPFEP